MFPHIQRSVLLTSGVAVLALASSPAFAQTQSGIDTTAGVHSLPLAVGGVAIMTLSDNTPSDTVAVNGKLQLSGWLGIGTTTPAAPLDVEGTGGVILNAGNVGIGTSTPQVALDVNGTVNATQYKVGYTQVTNLCSLGAASAGFIPASGVPVPPNGGNQSGSSLWCAALCPKGKAIMSGGCGVFAGHEYLIKSAPGGSSLAGNYQWQCTYNISYPAEALTILAVATCANLQ